MAWEKRLPESIKATTKVYVTMLAIAMPRPPEVSGRLPINWLSSTIRMPLCTNYWGQLGQDEWSGDRIGRLHLSARDADTSNGHGTCCRAQHLHASSIQSDFLKPLRHCGSFLVSPFICLVGFAIYSDSLGMRGGTKKTSGFKHKEEKVSEKFGN